MEASEALPGAAAARMQAAVTSKDVEPDYRLSFEADGLALALVLLKGMLLTLLTLGIYYPWYKTDRRIFTWQNIDVHGHRLRYHGTGKELFVGYVKVVIAYIVVVGFIVGASQVSPMAGAIAQMVVFAGMLWLIPLAIYGSRRFLLSRTSWRNIRFGLDGDSTEFTKILVKAYLLTVITLGLYGPIMVHRIYDYMIKNTRLGNQQFRYTGDATEYWKLSVKWLLISIFTLGIGSIWGLVATNRYQLAHTHFGDAHGVFNLTGGELFKLMIVQIFAITLTAGLAFPWVAVWSMNYSLTRMGLAGEIDFAAIGQAESTGDAAVDGLGDALDVGFGL